MPAPYKTLIPGDWLHLRDIIEDLYRILNVDTTFVALTSDAATNASDIVVLKSDVTAIQSDIVVIKSDILVNASDLLLAAGNDTEVQYNDGSFTAGDATFTFNKTTKEVTMQSLNVNGDILQTGAGRVIESSKFKLTAVGGLAILLTNTTGANTVAGQLVKADTATDDAVVLAAAGDTECFGVFLDSDIADDAEAWVVVSGIADVAFDDNVAAVHGNWVATGVLAGYARTSASPAAAPQHFEEIGHCIESVVAGGGGTHILARCVLHFN